MTERGPAGWRRIRPANKAKADRIVEQRRLHPFTSFGEFAQRGYIDVITLLSLARVGAMAEFHQELCQALVL